MGFTPIHIAAKFGHSSLIDKFAKTNVNVRQISRKTGMSALHIAAYYGEEGEWGWLSMSKGTFENDFTQLSRGGT